MMDLFSIGFSQPWLLLALLALPGLWVLLRVHPPRPKSILFPPFPLLSNDTKPQPEPRRLPLWLLMMRMLLCITVLLAMSGPVLEPEQQMFKGSHPLLLIVDDDWTSAKDWQARRATLDAIMAEAERTARPLALLALGNDRLPRLSSVAELRDQIRSLAPMPFTLDRMKLLAPIKQFLSEQPDADIVFLTTQTGRTGDPDFITPLNALLNNKKITLISNPSHPVLAITGSTNGPDGFTIHVAQSANTAPQSGVLRAFDSKNRPVGEVAFQLDASANGTDARLVLPTELRNDIARFEIDGHHSAGAVSLIDGQSRRRKIGLVSGTSSDAAQPLLSPNWFVGQALRPYADLIEPRGGPNEAIASLLDAKASMIILADVGNLSADIEQHLSDFIKTGGTLIRFAGPKMAAMHDSLMPVRIRPGDRSLGGALAWETPRHLAAFTAESPFFGLEAPADISVSRQLLAEPDADLGHKTWAALSDGTPLVTAERRGKGSLILFHITADTSWSSLPISGAFVGMLRRLVTFSNTGGDPTSERAEERSSPPLQTLNGFGVLGPPSANDKPLEPGARPVVDRDHPAGLYGDPENPVAINVLSENDTLSELDFSRTGADFIELGRQTSLDLRPLLLILSALLFAADAFATLILRAGFTLPSYRSVRTILGLAFVLSILGFHAVPTAQASPLAPKDSEGPLLTHIAYVITGDATLDETSRAGLSSLSGFLAEHTALEPGDPIGVDIATDDLAVYPLLYWPIAPGQPVPNATSLAKADAFMRDGGTILFDTHDAALSAPGVSTTPETKSLRIILAGLSVPELEPVPADHVLTKAFYLISRFPGRYAEGTTWIEALPKNTPEADQPIRAGDGVSPIILTSNDLAAAWASDRDGQPLYPLTQSMPRQREMAMRAGTNIVMYVLTGNYKADQVHIPALLERLGK